MLALAIVGVIVMILANLPESSGNGNPSTIGAVLRIVVGTALLLMAIKQWRGRPKEGEATNMPKWMKTIDTFTPTRSFRIAALMVVLNPRNIGLSLGAALAIAQVHLSGIQSAISMGIFVTIAGITIALPLILNVARGEKASATLGDWKQWLTQNSTAIIFILLLTMGFVKIGQGMQALLN